MRRPAVALGVCTLLLSVACARGITLATFEIDGHPSAVTTVGSRVWVADDINHAVHVLDADTGGVVGEPIEVSENPVALAAGGGSVWVAHANGRLASIDARTAEVRGIEKVGGSLTGVTYALGRVWATDLEQGELVAVDPDSLEVTAEIEIEDGAVRVAPGPDDTLWVTNSEDTVTRIVDGRVAGVRDVGPGPIGLASDGETVWVANSDANTVRPLRNGDVGEAVPVGRGPVAIAAFAGDAWAANQDDGTLTSVTAPGRPAIELGTHPRGVAAVEWFGRREIWVVGSNPDAVVRVQL